MMRNEVSECEDTKKKRPNAGGIYFNELEENYYICSWERPNSGKFIFISLHAGSKYWDREDVPENLIEVPKGTCIQIIAG